MRSFERADFICKSLQLLVPNVNEVFELQKLTSVLIKASSRLYFIGRDLKDKKIVKNPTLKYTWFLGHMNLIAKNLKKKPFTDALRVLQTAGFVVLNELDQVVKMGPLVNVTREILSSAPYISAESGLRDDELLLYTLVAYRRSLQSIDGAALSSSRLAKLARVTDSKAKAYLRMLGREGFVTLKKGSRKNIYRADKRLNKLYKTVDGLMPSYVGKNESLEVIENDAPSTELLSNFDGGSASEMPNPAEALIEAPTAIDIPKPGRFLEKAEPSQNRTEAEQHFTIVWKSFESAEDFCQMKVEDRARLETIVRMRAGIPISDPEFIKAYMLASTALRGSESRLKGYVERAINMVMPEREIEEAAKLAS